jgi:single-strand DNA-binding protein
MDFNSSTILGRMVDDPILTVNKKPDGTESIRCWARLAVNRPIYEGERKTDYIPITAFGKRADILSKYGKKGKEMLIRGSLRTNSKLRPDNTYDNYTEILVAEIILGNDPGYGKNAAKSSVEQPPLPAEQSSSAKTHPNPPPLTADIVAAIGTELTKLMQQMKARQKTQETQVPAQTEDNPF